MFRIKRSADLRWRRHKGQTSPYLWAAPRARRLPGAGRAILWWVSDTRRDDPRSDVLGLVTAKQASRRCREESGRRPRVTAATCPRAIHASAQHERRQSAGALRVRVPPRRELAEEGVAGRSARRARRRLPARRAPRLPRRGAGIFAIHHFELRCSASACALPARARDVAPLRRTGAGRARQARPHALLCHPRLWRPLLPHQRPLCAGGPRAVGAHGAGGAVEQCAVAMRTRRARRPHCHRLGSPSRLSLAPLPRPQCSSIARGSRCHRAGRTRAAAPSSSHERRFAAARGPRTRRCWPTCGSACPSRCATASAAACSSRRGRASSCRQTPTTLRRPFAPPTPAATTAARAGRVRTRALCGAGTAGAPFGWWLARAWRCTRWRSWRTAETRSCAAFARACASPSWENLLD